MARRQDTSGNGKRRGQAAVARPNLQRLDRPNRKSGLVYTRFALPTGNGWAARVARGLSRWREERQLTIPQAAERYRINQTAWYRIERGTHPATTAEHIDDLCAAIRVDIVELLKYDLVETR